MKRIRGLARLLIACCLAGATLEIAARADDWLRYRADPLAYYGPLNLRWVDDQGLSFNRPGIRYEIREHDEHGFRKHPHATAGDTTALDVVCLGTSESYGLYERAGREWPAALGALTAPDGFRSLNASVVGMSPFQYAAYLDRYVLPLRPEFVILLLSPFGVVQGMRGDEPLGAADFADPVRIDRMRASCRPTWKDGSRFLAKARASARSRLPAAWSDAIAAGLHRLSTLRRGAPSGRAAAHLDAPPPRVLEVYTRLMDDLSLRLAARGAVAIFATYPDGLRLDGSLAAAQGMRDRQLWLPDYTPAGLLAISHEFAAATRAHCDSLGYPLIDLEAALPKDADTFADSVHLTEAGAALAAAAARETLLQATGSRTRRGTAP